MKTNLKTNEKIIIEIKQHWFVLSVPTILTTLILAFSCFLKIKYPNIRMVILLVVNAACILYLIYKIVERNNNLWVVTTSRVIDEYGVFSSNSKDSPIDKINNISFSQSLTGKLFGYGNVQIQTAAEVGATTYSFVEQPKQLKEAITEAIDHFKHHSSENMAKNFASEKQQLKNSLAADLEELFDLKQKGILTEEEYLVQKQKLLNS